MLLLLLTVLLTLAFCRYRCAWTSKYGQNAVGFLHAPSGAGGGGERVLWVAIDQLQRADIQRNVERRYVLYTDVYGAGTDPREWNAELLALVNKQFHIALRKPVEFVYLNQRFTLWLSPERYPCLTLLLQTVVGGFALYWEVAVHHRLTPVVIDTVGVPMVYPLVKLLSGSSMVSYTHYPIVSSSMADRVRAGTVTTTNKGCVASNAVLRLLKLGYYQLFATLYRLLGQFPDEVLCNSSWTYGHISQLYWPRVASVVYPPCNVVQYSQGSLPVTQRSNDIVSVGQFRPEKDHQLQIHAFHKALPRLPKDCHLIMIGGARNLADRTRVKELESEVDRLELQGRVEIILNASFETVQKKLNSCCIGLHTMLDEHFGIVLLEYLAAGCIVLGHRSGGVCRDIINREDLGFLAVTSDEYAECMTKICEMKSKDPVAFSNYQQRGMCLSANFGDDVFGKQFLGKLARLLY